MAEEIEVLSSSGKDENDIAVIHAFMEMILDSENEIEVPNQIIIKLIEMIRKL